MEVLAVPNAVPNRDSQHVNSPRVNLLDQKKVILGIAIGAIFLGVGVVMTLNAHKITLCTMLLMGLVHLFAQSSPYPAQASAMEFSRHNTQPCCRLIGS